MQFHQNIARSFSSILVIFLVSSLIASCSATTPSPTAPPATSTQEFQATAANTMTPVPSPTSAVKMALLIAPEGNSDAQITELQKTLSSLALSSSLEFKTQQTLSAQDVEASTSVVVVLPPDPGLEEIAKASPQTQFVAIGIENLKPSGNLSVIGPQGFQSDNQSFLAGYIAALLTNDFRVGIISQNAQDSTSVQAAFINGVRFYCGLCRPAFPPYGVYPQASEVTGGGTNADWKAAADTLLQGAVSTIYVTPASSSPDLLNYLVESGVDLIGGQTPPESITSKWIATVLPDPASALQQIWPDLIEGKGEAQLAMPFKVTDTGSGLLNAARQRLVNATMKDLVDGYISPDTITGP